MKDWEKDRIWIWLIAASNNKSRNNVRYYIDVQNEILFCLKVKRGTLKPTEKGDPQYMYGTEQHMSYLKKCIDRISRKDDSILEFPPIDETFPFLEDPNARIFSSKKEDIERMNNSYRSMVYSEKLLGKINVEFQNIELR
ncbi:MAG: hypothetical protein RIC35_22665 [Marinoscillum sp.]